MVPPLARDFRGRVDHVPGFEIIDRLAHLHLQPPGEDVADFLPFMEKKVSWQAFFRSDFYEIWFGLDLEIHRVEEPGKDRVLGHPRELDLHPRFFFQVP